jgi:hypothetical protein
MGGGYWFGPCERLWYKMFQIPWSSCLPLITLLALVWSDLSSVLLLFSFMPVLQLGFTLPWQALEGRHPSKPCPPPLPDPFCLSWPLQLLYFVLALGTNIHRLHGASFQLLVHFGSRCSSHDGVLETSVSFSISCQLCLRSQVNAAGCAGCDLCLRLDCFLFPAAGLIVGLLCDLGSFSLVGQCSCLVLGL